ncbi:hypothetical protein MMC26_002541 [Xylographa opegraphella]|nr:hypothetical protein [Xylographa opegraphella]
MTDVGQKITDAGFMIASSVTLGIAIILSVARMYIKVNKFHRLYSDDWFFLGAVCFLIAGTTMVFLTLPYNQTEVNVGAGVEAPPPDLTHQLDFDVKFQDSASLLLNASIFSVKFSFLLFFRRLLERTGKLQQYWWFAFIITIPCAVVCMCTEFIVCPAFGDRIMETCVSPTAIKRQVAILYTVVVLDIFTDLLVISIPVLLLWNVKVNIRRKIGLGCLLCLSIFAIITNIIRAAGHKLDNGQSDVVWILFWGEMEACIAVMANSMTAFRSLFRVGLSKVRKSPQDPKNQSPLVESSELKHRPHVDLPTMPRAKLSGMRSLLFRDPFEDEDEDATDSERTLRTSQSWSGWSTEGNSLVTPKPTNRAACFHEV